MTRTDLHRIVDQLPEAAVQLAAQLLAAVRDNFDPVALALQNAPEDDEPLSPEDEAAIEEGLEAARRGDVVTSEQLRRELGL